MTVRSGDNSGALNAYKDYMQLEEKSINDLIRNNLLFTKQKFELQSSYQQDLTKKNYIIYISIACAGILLLFCFIIMLLLRNAGIKRRVAEASRLLSETQAQIIRTKNNELTFEMDSMGKDLEKEKEFNQKIRQREYELSHKIEYLVSNKLGLIREILSSKINDKNGSPVPIGSNLANSHGEKEEFLNFLIEDFKISYPKLLRSLTDKGLTDSEIQYICLCGMGLKGAEIGKYTDNPSHYNLSRDLRKKLGIDNSKLYLTKYINQLMQEEYIDQK